MEIKYNMYDRWRDPKLPQPIEHLSNHIGTTIWICCYNKNRTTFPQKAVVDSTDWVKLFDKKGNVSKKQLAVHGVGDGSNVLKMFTDKQECINRFTELINKAIKNVEIDIIDLEARKINFENLIIEANKL